MPHLCSFKVASISALTLFRGDFRKITCWMPNQISWTNLCHKESAVVQLSVYLPVKPINYLTYTSSYCLHHIVVLCRQTCMSAPYSLSLAPGSQSFMCSFIVCLASGCSTPLCSLIGDLVSGKNTPCMFCNYLNSICT